MNDFENDLLLLRSLVARELETVNCYRLLARECEDVSAVEFIQHIIDEEKFHIADTLQAIAQIDESQSDLFKRGFTEGHKPGELPSDLSGNAAGALPHRPVDSSAGAGADSTWTVGSLRGVPQNQ